jgi:dTMP kinase
MKKGLLISFEGGEGAGKTEQSKVLEQKLVEHGKEVVRLREPGGTKISEQIREVVLSAKNTNMFDRTEVLLFQAARAQIYGELVIPALKKGSIVLMDRTRDSSVVYQGVVRDMGVDLIEQLNKISTVNTYPDLTLLLDVSPAVGLKRRAEASAMDRIDSENQDFHQKVRDAYLSLAKKNDRNRWVTINAEQEFEKVSQDIWQTIQSRLSIS